MCLVVGVSFSLLCSFRKQGFCRGLLESSPLEGMNIAGVNQRNPKLVARGLEKKLSRRSSRHRTSIQRPRSKMVNEEEVNYEIGQRIETQEDAAVFIKAETEKGTILSERGYGACKPPFSYWPYFLRCANRPFDATNHREGYINLAVAQNFLAKQDVQDKVREICKNNENDALIFGL